MMEWVEYMTSDAISPMANLRRQNGREKPWRLPFFGIANEPWGCGGNMRPEYYADEYRRYNTFVKNYDRAKPIYRIAAGANSQDYKWTEVLMSVAGRRMDGLSLHYYTLPTGNWAAKGPATGFGEDQWFSTLRCTCAWTRSSRSTRRPTRRTPIRVGLVVDGGGYDAEKGRSPFSTSRTRCATLVAASTSTSSNGADRVP
jgi:alpha-N-arabinofuranosidase